MTVRSLPQADRPYGGQALAERVAARRARFIAAGLAVFGRQGLRAATVRGVCAEAGLTDRYFYESFASLEALLQAVYLNLIDGLRSGLREALAMPQTAATQPPDELRHTAAAFEAWFELVSDPLRARIVLAEVLGVSAEMDALYEARMDEMATLTTAPLAQLLPGPPLSPARRALVGRALVGAAVQVAKCWMTGGYQLPRDEVVRTCVLVASGTVQALRAEALPS
jgi:AcrR family transcriptional regulator